MLQVSPNWTKILTAKEAEREIKGFVFRGPGLYLSAESTLLVVSTAECPPSKRLLIQSWIWKQSWPENTKFEFCVWNVPFRQTILSSKVPIPTRKYEDEDNCFDASDLGLAPGEWPETLDHNTSSYALSEIVKDSEGSILHVVYTCLDHKLIVVND